MMGRKNHGCAGRKSDSCIPFLIGGMTMKFRKLVSAALAMSMAFGMSSVAFAEDTY